MTVGTSNGDLSIYRGDRFTQPWGFVDWDGTVIDDLVLTSGNTTATSVSAPFVASHTGKLLTISDGSGLADGTTMTYVSPTTVTLSAAPSATRSGVVAYVAALNCSPYSGHAIMFRPSEDSVTVVSATVTTSRAAYGAFVFTILEAVTATMARRGSWDWQATHSTYGDSTLVQSRHFTVTKDTTHA